MNAKRIISVILTAVFALSLFSCGNGADGITNTAESSVSVTETEETVTEETTINEELFKEYEPENQFERIFKEYFDEPDADRLIDLSVTKPVYRFPETAEDAAEGFASKIRGKNITYGYYTENDRPVLNVKADWIVAAHLYLKESGEKTEYGQPVYELDKIELVFDEPAVSVNVRLPERFTAYANGIKIPDEYTAGPVEKEDVRNEAPEGAFLLTYKTYTLAGLYKQPEITVKDGSGADVSLSYDAEKNLYSCKYEYSAELEEQYSAFVKEGMKRYAIYMQNDGSFGDVKKYFDPGSVLYEDIRKNPGSFVWEHDGYKVENETVSEFFDYGNGIFSCRVKLDHILKRNGKEDYIDRVDLTCYLHKVGDEYRIYEMQTHGDTVEGDVSDGIEFYRDEAGTFRAYVMIVHDPSKVFVGVSSNDFPNAVRGQRIYDAAEKYGAAAAINGGEFSDPGGEGLGGQPIGITFSQGKCVWNDKRKRTFIGIDKDNNLVLADSMTKEEAEALGIRDGVSFQSGNIIIETKNGVTEYRYAPEKTEKAQRTAIGQRADGKFVFIVTDGRTASSIGASYDDMIDMLIKYGAVNAGMLDGGSSAMMYYSNYIEKYNIDTKTLDEYQRMGLVNSYKAFTRPRYLPTFFMVAP